MVSNFTYDMNGSLWRTFGLTALASLFMALPRAHAGVGDGPRIYQAAPVGTQIMTVIAARQNSNYNIDGNPFEPAARVEADALAAQYTKVVEIANRTAGVFALLPYADVEGNLIGGARQPASKGIGDVQIGAVIGLIGSPAMDAKQFAAFDPGFSFGVVGKLSLPTGKYDSNKAINLGTNRWATQLGAVFAWYFGDSLRPGSVTSLEFTPNVWLYGDNEDPRGANVLEQDPLYNLEMHLTHDFSQQFWGALDAVYKTGGATTTDGIPSGDDIDTIGVGFTIGTYLPDGMNLQFSYGETVDNDIDDFDDWLYRIKFSTAF